MNKFIRSITIMIVAIFLVGCAKKDMTEETLESIKISRNEEYLLSYDVEVDKKNNKIILKEDEYKTPYLKLEENESSFIVEKGTSVLGILFSIRNMKEKSSNIEMRDKKGDTFLIFNNQKIIEEEEDSQLDFSMAIDDYSENQHKYRSMPVLLESIENYFDEYELNEDENELVVIEKDPSTWDVILLRSISYEKAPEDLVVKLFDDKKDKIVEFKNGEIVNFNEEKFNESDFEKEYEEDAIEGYEYLKERIEEKYEDGK